MSFDLIKDLISAIIDIVSGFKDLFGKNDAGQLNITEIINNLKGYGDLDAKSDFDKANPIGLSSRKPNSVNEL